MLPALDSTSRVPPGTLTGVKGSADLAARVVGVVTTRWRKWRHRRLVSNRIHLLLQEASLHVNHPDTANIQVSFRIVNFTRHPVTVDRIEIDSSRINMNSLPEQSEFLRGSGQADPSEVGFGSFSMRLHADGVRIISSAVKAGPYPRSSPNADIVISGWCVLHYRGRQIRKHFEFNARNPYVNVPEFDGLPRG